MIFSIKHREKKMDYSNKAQHNYIGSETLVLLWNGTSKKANEIMVGDMIVTENGTSGKVENIIQKQDQHLYQVSTVSGKEFVVNSNHSLRLQCLSHKQIFGLSDTISGKNSWMTSHCDEETKRMVYRYEQDIEKLQERLEDVRDENIFDVPVSTYITYYNTQEQGNFVLDTNSKAIEWEKKTMGMCENYEYGMSWKQ
jgi:hypothetical protein